MTRLLSPDCPFCGEPPQLVVNPVQAFCGNDDCSTFCWDMTQSVEYNRTHMTVHDVSDVPVLGRNWKPPES
jgi:hypothetical protein